MKLTTLAMTICAIGLLSSCGEKPVVYQGPLFCDLYEQRRFSQEEIDWRIANAPWNLKRDLTNNEDFGAECADRE